MEQNTQYNAKKDDSIGALWRKTSANGAVFYSGKIGDKQIVVFKNNFKDKENQPDFRIYESKPQVRAYDQDSGDRYPTGPSALESEAYRQPEPAPMTRAERAAYMEELGQQDTIDPASLTF